MKVTGFHGGSNACFAWISEHGHETMVATRDTAKLAEWHCKNPKARIGNFSETATFGEVVALAVKGSAAVDVLGAAGAAKLDGNLATDACNPIADALPVNGVLRFFTTLDRVVFPRHFVKAFNSVGAPRMVNPEYKDGRRTMFICGNDDNANAVRGFPISLGWEIAGHGQCGSGTRH